jgi:hypothetical protein
MDNFKNALQLLKEKKSSTAQGGKGYIRYGDVIKEKLKENKKEEVFRNFDEIEKEREEWVKVRNENLKKEMNNKTLINNNDEEGENCQNKNTTEITKTDLTINENKEESKDKSAFKEYKVTVEPNK